MELLKPKLLHENEQKIPFTVVMHLRFSCPTEAGAKIHHFSGVAAY